MKKYAISEELYIKIMNLATLPDVCDCNITLTDLDSGDDLNLQGILQDLQRTLDTGVAEM